MDFVSVIIPMFNSEKSIVKCLDSVKNQDFRGKFEIIIVDDGSTDSSVSLVENFKMENPELNICLIKQENSGVSKARNVGLKKAEGNYIALLDSDDVWLETKTQKQIDVLKNSSIDFVTSLWNDEKVYFPYSINPTTSLVEISFRKLMIRITGQTSTAIFKKRILDKTGYFDENQRYSEDANFWLRVTEHYSMALIPERLAIVGDGKKAFGESGLSANLKEMEKGIQKNIKEMYDTKRISILECALYYLFSKLKYIVRRFR